MAKVVKFPAEGATTDFSDEDISNVGSIALDEITSDSATSVTVTLGTDAGDDFIVGPSNKMVVEGDTGKVGVGTATPRRAVDVLDASNPQLRLSRTDDSNYADLEVSANNNLIASQVDNVIVQGNDTHTFIAIQNDAAFINTGVSNQVDSATTNSTSGITIGVNGTAGYLLNRYGGDLIIGTTNTEALRISTTEDATFVANLSANGNATLGDASSDTHTVNGSLGISDTSNTATLSATSNANLLTEGTPSSFYNIVRGPTGAYSIYQNNTTGDADGSGKGLEVGTTNNDAFVRSYGSGSNGTLNIGAGGSGGLTFSATNDITVLAGYFALQSEETTPSTPADGDGGILYVKSDGKLYFISHETSETDLTSGGGGGGITVVSKENTDSPYTAAAGQFVEVTSGPFTLNLPAATTAGDVIDVFIKDALVQAVTISPNSGDTINYSSADLRVSGNARVNYTFVADGTSNWFIR